MTCCLADLCPLVVVFFGNRRFGKWVTFKLFASFPDDVPYAYNMLTRQFGHVIHDLHNHELQDIIDEIMNSQFSARKRTTPANTQLLLHTGKNNNRPEPHDSAVCNSSCVFTNAMRLRVGFSPPLLYTSTCPGSSMDYVIHKGQTITLWFYPQQRNAVDQLTYIWLRGLLGGKLGLPYKLCYMHIGLGTCPRP